MTSTPFNVGLNDGARLSSRVLRPPGGGHTDIFSGEPEPAPRGRRGAPPVQNTAAAHQQESKPTNGATHNGQEQQHSEAKSAEPTLAPASSPVEQPTKAEAPRAEPLKAEAPRAEPPKAEAPRAEPIKVEPPKRVRVPPGGFSSGLW